MNLALIKRFTVLLLLIVTLLTSAIGFVFWRWLHLPLTIPQDARVVFIEKGSNLSRVAFDLQSVGLIQWPQVWVAFARFSGNADINAGEYRLNELETPASILTKFQSLDVVQYKVTFIEGSTTMEALSQLQISDKLVKTIASVKSVDQLVIDGLDEEILEGWLFPDTYYFSAGDTDLSVLLRAYRKMKSVLAEEWMQRDANLPYDNAYEALIMASIIEKETGAPHEREQIAGVFVRRLLKKMRLQTDPTVIYGLGETYQGNITRAHLRQTTPYNTYVIKGLPPTPIALPGRASIRAALHPAEGDALYFVARGDGTHQFSATIDEHNAAVQQYQKRRKKSYRSTYQDRVK